MNEHAAVKIALVVREEFAERVTARLLACHVSRENIIVDETRRWQQVAKHEPSLCIWDLTESDLAN